MAVKIVAVGKMKNRALAELAADYARRLERYGGVETTELGDGPDAEKEGERILKALCKFKGRIYALSEEGVRPDSRGFAAMLEGDLARGESAFVLGGSYGLSKRAKDAADEVVSLSPLTFTREFARVILLEQIYRAKNISANTPYHH